MDEQKWRRKAVKNWKFFGHLLQAAAVLWVVATAVMIATDPDILERWGVSGTLVILAVSVFLLSVAFRGRARRIALAVFLLAFSGGVIWTGVSAPFSPGQIVFCIVLALLLILLALRLLYRGTTREFFRFIGGKRSFLDRAEKVWDREKLGISSPEEELRLVDGMTGTQFEVWCAVLLRRIGFTDVSLTPETGDQGVDILATRDSVRYAIQCKCYSSDLGNTPVQEVHTGKVIYHCQIGAVMTNRRFTPGGRTAAEATGVLLWDRDWIRGRLEENPEA